MYVLYRYILNIRYTERIFILKKNYLKLIKKIYRNTFSIIIEPYNKIVDFI